MACLTARFGGDDVALLRRVLGVSATGATPGAPCRVVVDAHVPPRRPEIAETARVAGVPLLIDPQTFYLQDYQHPRDPWALLPFADARIRTPADLHARPVLDCLAAECIEFQLLHGASAVMAPYLHIEGTDDGWLRVQLALWRATARYLSAQQVPLPVIAVVAVGWRLLPRLTWTAAIDPLAAGARELGATEIALAASKVDQGAHPDQRLADYLATIRRLRRTAPVTAWQQGVLGEAAVAAGAAGYETGIGRRERCDLRSAMGQHRQAADPNSPRAPRGVYIPQLGRSIPKRSLEAIFAVRRLGAGLRCTDPGCCPGGRASMLGDARTHALSSRVRRLHQQQHISRPAWRWNRLAVHADIGLDLAARIGVAADRTTQINRVDTGALRAIKAVADHRRQTLRRRRAA